MNKHSDCPISSTAYDNQGREYSSTQFSVDPSTAAVSTIGLTNLTFYDARGETGESLDASGQATKMAYDGAGRNVITYITDGGAVNNSGVPLTTFAAAGSIAGDVVLMQSQSIYDADSDVIVEA